MLEVTDCQAVRENVKKFYFEMADSGPNPAKRKKIVLSLLEKLELLDLLNTGESATAVGRLYGLNESTVRSIRAKEAKIRESARNVGSNESRKVAYARGDLLEKTEQALGLWVELNRRNVPIVSPLIRDKAAEFYHSFKSLTDDVPNSDCKFSKGWLEHFKMRFDIKLSSDPESSTQHVSEIQAYIEEQGYSTDQVFTADQTVLFWNKFPERTFLAKIDEKFGYEIENRVSVLLCVNASGHVMKPMVVHKHTHSTPFKNVYDLPVIWKSAKRPWVTSAMFVDWFQEHFIPDAKKYLKSKGAESKILLLVDETPGRVRMLNAIDPEVTVMILPSHSIKIPQSSAVFIHPMSEVIINFKVCYVRNLFQRIMDAVIHQLEASISIWLKNFSMLPGLIDKATQDMGKSAIQACWREILPKVYYEVTDSPSLEEQIQEIVELAQRTGGEGLCDMTSQEIEEVVFFESVGLSDEDIVNVVEEFALIEEGRDEEPPKKQKPKKQSKQPKNPQKNLLIEENCKVLREAPNQHPTSEDTTPIEVTVEVFSATSERTRNSAPGLPAPGNEESDGISSETTLNWVNELLNVKDNLSRLVADSDPDEDRYITFQVALEAAAQPYKELREHLRGAEKLED